MIISFSELWEKSEDISKNSPPSDRTEIFFKLENLIKDYAKLDNIPSEEIKNILSTKKLGEILFELTKISRLDNINSYAALQMEVQIADKINP